MGKEIPAELHELARFQAGMVTRQQALGCGLSTSAITSKVRHGRWRQIYRGVYATFTGPVNREAQLWAAVLYAGKGAQLSHETAAELHGLPGRRSPLIHVTIPASRRVTPARGVVIHISARTDTGARFPPGVLPRTFVEETILDLVDAARSLDDACGWVTSAFGQGLTGEGPLRATMCSRKKLRWRRQIDEIITAAAGGAHSVLEFRYDRDVERAHGLPAAQHQVPFTKPNGRRGFRDRYYGEYGLVVELDGKQAHPEERRGVDRSRDNGATAEGGSTLRYGWDDVTRDGCATAAQVAESLHARGWTGELKPCSPACRARGVAEDNGNSVCMTRGVSVRSGNTACAPAARRSPAGYGPVATPTARAPEVRAASMSSGVSPMRTVDSPSKSLGDVPCTAPARRRATWTSSVRTS
jgi:hypothetical protein